MPIKYIILKTLQMEHITVIYERQGYKDMFIFIYHIREYQNRGMIFKTLANL